MKTPDHESASRSAGRLSRCRHCGHHWTEHANISNRCPIIELRRVDWAKTTYEAEPEREES